MIIISLNGKNYILTFQSTDNPWDKLHNTIPLPDGPASLFDHDVDNSHTISTFDEAHDIHEGK